MSDDFRCSVAARVDEEPMAGTAPTERAFLFVEYSGAWGSDAPALLADHVDVPAGVRPALIRRTTTGESPRRAPAADGLTVFVAWHDGDRFRIETTRLGDLAELGRLKLAVLAEARSPGLTPWTEPLWLVCTNGRRDRCCAELGRPVAAALGEVWPGQTWETTHLGGHRFAGTLLALPSGITLGRLDPASAVLGCSAIAEGRHPSRQSRGRAGWPAAAQVAELFLIQELGRAGGLRTVSVDGSRSEVTFEQGVVLVETETGPARRLSCGDLKAKPILVHRTTLAG